MGALDGDVERLRAAEGRILALRSRVEAAAPPPGEPNTEHDWAAGEILAHCAEMLPYWRTEIDRILAAPDDGSAVPFGRVSTDVARTMTVDRDRTLPPAELFRRVTSGVEEVAGRLAGLDDGAAARRGLHPRLGEMTVAEIADRFLATHLEEHADQLAETVAGT